MIYPYLKKYEESEIITAFDAVSTSRLSGAAWFITRSFDDGSQLEESQPALPIVPWRRHYFLHHGTTPKQAHQELFLRSRQPAVYSCMFAMSTHVMPFSCSVKSCVPSLPTERKGIVYRSPAMEHSYGSLDFPSLPCQYHRNHDYHIPVQSLLP